MGGYPITGKNIITLETQGVTITIDASNAGPMSPEQKRELIRIASDAQNAVKKALKGRNLHQIRHTDIEHPEPDPLSPHP